jgi:chromosome segregation ATPase
MMIAIHILVGVCALLMILVGCLGFTLKESQETSEFYQKWYADRGDTISCLYRDIETYKGQIKTLKSELEFLAQTSKATSDNLLAAWKEREELKAKVDELDFELRRYREQYDRVSDSRDEVWMERNALKADNVKVCDERDELQERLDKATVALYAVSTLMETAASCIEDGIVGDDEGGDDDDA